MVPQPMLVTLFMIVRGEILTFVGPMVYGTAFCPLSKIDEVKKLGFAGISKQMYGRRKSIAQNEYYFLVINALDTLTQESLFDVP